MRFTRVVCADTLRSAWCLYLYVTSNALSYLPGWLFDPRIADLYDYQQRRRRVKILSSYALSFSGSNSRLDSAATCTRHPVFQAGLARSLFSPGTRGNCLTDRKAQVDFPLGNPIERNDDIQISNKSVARPS